MIMMGVIAILPYVVMEFVIISSVKMQIPAQMIVKMMVYSVNMKDFLKIAPEMAIAVQKVGLVMALKIVKIKPMAVI